MKQRIYWRIKNTLAYSFMVEFWAKADRSDALTTTMLLLDNDKLRAKVTHLTGKTQFELIQFKGIIK